ncbi:DNA-binding transcriptional regulator, MerR family [Azotobacter beijerinckii]|uniref:DNA-binding transcriptional regulator, MerR family n=1 Tax=Azotobacter beijerinckii TaxID=170623 RepID=A0A1H9PFH9_9GAMM|nr:MerR family transcriptional regulator [Azotobacter beijerinckii]SER46609.1 DNA-binding transcriptional regulator, MerR family [Azotobacter beijerinckii]
MTELSGASPLAPSPPALEELFPIREVVRLTGVNPVTLRAWERRYGLIQPVRTDGGHRLYSQADIEAIRSILAWTERGVAVSKVGSILARSAASKAATADAGEAPADGEWSEWQARLGLAVSHFDETRLEQLYGQVFSTYPLAAVFQEILLPLWQELLRREGFGQTSQWLFLDAFLRARVLQRLQLGRGPADERVLVAAIPGQCRELELLVAGLLLDGDSGSVRVLPVGQPLEELALVCQEVRPRALVLYSKTPPSAALVRQLGRLALAVDCLLAVAGEASELGEGSLGGTPIACLGSSGRLMSRRLAQFLAGHLDT